MNSIKDQISWLKKEHSNLQSFLEKAALSMPTGVALNGVGVDSSASSAANYDLISSMVSSQLEEGSREFKEMHQQLLDKIAELSKPKQEHLNGRTNWALRSLGTRIYRLGTSAPFKKTKGWRRVFEAAGRPTLVQSSLPIIEKGDCWCFEGGKGRMTLAFATPLHVKAVRIQNPFDAQPSNIKVYGRSSAFSQSDKLLGSFAFTNDLVQVEEKMEAIKYLRLEFDSDGQEKTCIYRVAVYGNEVV